MNLGTSSNCAGEGQQQFNSQSGCEGSSLKITAVWDVTLCSFIRTCKEISCYRTKNNITWNALVKSFSFRPMIMIKMCRYEGDEDHSEVFWVVTWCNRASWYSGIALQSCTRGVRFESPRRYWQSWGYIQGFHRSLQEIALVMASSSKFFPIKRIIITFDAHAPDQSSSTHGTRTRC
jgi:hypothetical protein